MRGFNLSTGRVLRTHAGFTLFRNMDYVHAGPKDAREIIKVGRERNLETMLFRTLECLSEFISDVDEPRFKAGRFVLMMEYIAEHLDTFRETRLAALIFLAFA